MIIEFPPVESADPDTGLLAVGGDLEIGSLQLAYRSGVFPWPARDEPILWFAPPQRAIIEFSEFKVPKRTARDLKNSSFQFSVDRHFERVIRACASMRNRKGQYGTWITGEMMRAYINFHKAGFARSFETLTAQGELVGGMYGVLIGKYFAGESMFYRESNASKFALVNAIDYLTNCGLTWMDVQVLSPFLARFGAKEIPRALFMQKLRIATT